MRKLCIGGCNFGNRSKTSALAVLISAVAVTTASTAIVRADTVLGQFTLTNYYTPTSPTDPTPTDPSNPLSATVTFTYLNPSANGGNNLAVTIDNTSTPYSSNELIRDVVFQVSDNGSLLTQPSQLGGKNGVFVQPGAKVCTINQDFFVLFSSL